MLYAECMVQPSGILTEPRNTLDKAASSYLRSAMHQPVYWQEWGEAAFALAAQAGKPILLDVGAVWCHWCHVMDRESYEDAAMAATINEHFVAIKVDRDERPDVDARYQAAVQAISGQGGWPLTAILTPDGRPFFAGTYFPREDRYGRPGFERVLLTLANAWKTRRDEVLESASSVIAAIEHGETFSARGDSLSFGIVAAIRCYVTLSVLFRANQAAADSSSFLADAFSGLRFSTTESRSPIVFKTATSVLSVGLPLGESER